MIPWIPCRLRRTAVRLTLAFAVALAVGAMTVGIPDQALAFPEETETQGEIETDLNGVWLVVHHLKFNRPTPQVTPGADEVPTTRIFNVLNLFKITHLKKDAAQKVREQRAAQVEASVAKAEAIIAKQTAAKDPVEDADGQVEGGPRVLVPQVPRPPGYDPAMHAGDDVEVFLLDVNLPKSIDDAFQAAQKAETEYEPSAKDIALLRSSWNKLDVKKETEYSRIEWKVVAPNFYDQGLQVDPMLKDTIFTITGTQGMIPRPSQPSRNIVVYGIREEKDGVMSGTHSRAMMATAPFPIPIEMNGLVEFIKVADLPAPAASGAPAKDETKPEKDDATPEKDDAEPKKEGQPAS